MDPWYRVVTPRKEVREGRSFNPDEFAIALDQVVDAPPPRTTGTRHSSSRGPSSLRPSRNTRAPSCAACRAGPKAQRPYSPSSPSSVEARPTP